MLRTLIIDDEYWVCQLICDLIDWNSHGFEIIGQAYSGMEALDAIEEKKPDLVFTDIRMPGLNGLELMEICKTRFPEVKFVIISGHSEFEYAQSALKNGALGYLLKPVEPEELTALISEIRNSFSTQIQKALEDQQLKEQLLENKRKLKEQYFSALLKENIAVVDTLPLALINSECGSTFTEGMFLVFHFTLDIPDTSCFFDTIASYISQKIYGDAVLLCHDLVVIKQYNSIICLTNFTPDLSFDVKKLFRDQFYTFKQQLPDLSSYTITLGIGSVSEHYISQAFLTAQEAVQSRNKLGTNRIIDWTSSGYQGLNETLPPPFGVPSSQDASFSTAADSAVASSEDSSSISAAQKLLDYIDQNYHQEISLGELASMVYLNTKYISDLFKKEYSITITDYIAKKRMEEAQQLLLDTDFSIIEVSDQVGYHDAKYFSKLFKRYHGISPAQYRKLYQ